MADLTIVADDVLVSGPALITGIAGEAITPGDLVYVKAADSKLYKAHSGTAAAADADGVAVNSAAIGQPITYTPSGNLTTGGDVVVGQVYVVSATAGKICPDTDLEGGDYVTVVGIGKTTSLVQLLFVPAAVAKAASS